MLKEKILDRLKEMNQLHLAEKLDVLSEREMERFLGFLSPELLRVQQEKLQCSAPSSDFEPITEAGSASDQWASLGIERLTQGKVGCLILAGGQGSRLGLSIPKALLPVTADGKKTLLEILVEKISLAAAFHRVKIPCVVIVSHESYGAIDQFLKDKKMGDFITLVVQDEAPFLDDQGNWILRENGTLATGPDGNGYALHLLEKSGILKKWKGSGIEEITIVPIENPLADPVDPVLIGYHVAHPADVTVKVIYRQNTEEKVGILVHTHNRTEVREYSEIPQDKPLKRCLANIGLFAINLSFAERVSHEKFPWHLARKQDRVSNKWIWKFEHFIFDMLPFSLKTNLLLYPREDVYAPLKGTEGLASVQAALSRVLKN